MDQHSISTQFETFISQELYPCVMAKHVVARQHIKIMNAGNICCPHQDNAIVEFIYNFITDFRKQESLYHSVAIVFDGPLTLSEEEFEKVLWLRLNSLREIDAKSFPHDNRVDEDPSSINYSFSLMSEAFYVLAMHPQSSRRARKFSRPALVFNPHAQFEEMKSTEAYDKLKGIVRKRDMTFSGSINPMLSDFGEKSEVFQYSGKQYDSAAKCPFKK